MELVAPDLTTETVESIMQEMDVVRLPKPFGIVLTDRVKRILEDLAISGYEVGEVGQPLPES